MPGQGYENPTGSGIRRNERQDKSQNGRLSGRQSKKQKRQQQIHRQRIACVVVMALFVVLGAVMAKSLDGKSGKNLGEDGKAIPADGGRVERLAERETASPEQVRSAWKKADVPDLDMLYSIHSHAGEWSNFFADNSYGMAPVGSYLTAIRVALREQPDDMTGTVECSVNLSGSGWLDWCENGAEAGKADGEMALEAIRLRLTGDLAEYYDVFYSVLQDNAWTDWMKNGEEAGVSGAGLHVDGVRMSVVPRKEGETAYASGIDPEKPMVALTYDDGPSKNATPVILKKLAECGGRATFFMVGKQAERYPELVRQMVDQGCEVANHTYSHTSMNKQTPQQLTEDLARTNRIVVESSGVTPVLMRPVGGARNDAGMDAVGAISMPAILWSVDTLDWKTRDAASTIQTVREQVKDGDIILMHDLYETTAEASLTIIEELTAQGFQLVTVSELSSYRGGILPGKTYGKFRK